MFVFNVVGWGSVSVFVLVCKTLCSFQFSNHLEEYLRAGCFSLLSYGCLVTVNVLWLFITVLWAGLQC